MSSKSRPVRFTHHPSPCASFWGQGARKKRMLVGSAEGSQGHRVGEEWFVDRSSRWHWRCGGRKAAGSAEPLCGPGPLYRRRLGAHHAERCTRHHERGRGMRPRKRNPRTGRPKDEGPGRRRLLDAPPAKTPPKATGPVSVIGNRPSLNKGEKCDYPTASRTRAVSEGTGAGRPRITGPYVPGTWLSGPDLS